MNFRKDIYEISLQTRMKLDKWRIKHPDGGCDVHSLRDRSVRFCWAIITITSYA